MAIDINRAEATRILDASRASCLESPSSDCLIKDEIDYEGVSVIIPRRECIQTASRHAREKARNNKEA